LLEVPAGTHLYGAYNKELRHFRRYDARELRKKLNAAGFQVVRSSHLGFLVYPGFALVKRRSIRADLLSQGTGIVREQASRSYGSLLMRAAFGVEAKLGRFVSFPCGIRCLAVGGKTV